MKLGTPVESSLQGARGVRLHTRRWLPAESPGLPILLVHGFSEHSGRWTQMARVLSSRGFDVFAYDHRGHGLSDGRRGELGSFDLFVEDLRRARAWIGDEVGFDRHPYVYAHSMGALIALRYLQADRAATAGVVLSAPWLRTALPVPWWKERLAAVLRRVAPDVTMSSGPIAPELKTSDPAALEALREDPLIHHRISPRFFDEVGRAQAWALEEGLDPSVRVLILIPLADRITDPVTALAWAEALEGSQVTVRKLEGVLHEPHHDIGRELLLEDVIRWLLAAR